MQAVHIVGPKNIAYMIASELINGTSFIELGPVDYKNIIFSNMLLSKQLESIIKKQIVQYNGDRHSELWIILYVTSTMSLTTHQMKKLFKTGPHYNIHICLISEKHLPIPYVVKTIHTCDNYVKN